MDISRERKKTLEDYGAQPGTASFANNCLLGRRLVEKGVRYMPLFDWSGDFHGANSDEEFKTGLVKRCEKMDRRVAALIRDLKGRRLLNETLVICGGGFGRTPFREGRTAASALLGCDPHPDGDITGAGPGPSAYHEGVDSGSQAPNGPAASTSATPPSARIGPAHLPRSGCLPRPCAG